MTLSPFFQSTLLSGTLALSALGCGPQNASLQTSGSSAPSSCPMSGLPDPKESGIAIAALSQRGADPASFYPETRDRFAMLAGVCTPPEISAYSQFQDKLAASVAALPLPKLRDTMEGLYRRAYVYDAAAGTMAFGMSASHVRAKKELDFWIAAVSRRAYENEDFLNGLSQEGGIEAVISLTSPKMSDQDRGDLERLIQAHKKGPAETEKALLEINKASYERLLAWMDGYEGNAPFLSDPFWISALDAFSARLSLFGKEETIRLETQGFPKAEVRRLLDQRKLTKSYDELAKLPNDVLLKFSYDIQVAAQAAKRPAVVREAVRGSLVTSMLLHERGLLSRPVMEKFLRDDLAKAGWDPKDADRAIDPRQSLAKESHTRLDNYRARFSILQEYRALYEQVVGNPPDAVFTPEKLARLNVWNLIINKDNTGAPIQLAELDAIRKDVRKQSSPWKDATATGASFASRDKKGSLWIMPKDLGLCGVLAGGVLAHLGDLASDGKTLNDLVCRNVELIALLPSARMPERGVASSLGVFGMMIVSNEGSDAGHDWTPGALARVLGYGAALNDFFRRNFENHPRRLNYRAVGQRAAHAMGKGFLAGYLARPDAGKDEKWLEGILDFDKDSIVLANRRLGISETEMSPGYWDPGWDSQPLEKFLFQPGQMATRSTLEKITNGSFGPVTPDEAAKEGDRVLKGAILGLLSDPKERKEALEALEFLQSPSNSGNTFRLVLSSHPLTRVVNVLRRDILQEGPLLVLDADQNAWAAFQNDLGRHTTALLRFQKLRKAPVP